MDETDRQLLKRIADTNGRILQELQRLEADQRDLREQTAQMNRKLDDILWEVRSLKSLEE